MSQRKILVVDDVGFNRDLIIQLLEDEYKVIEAADGEEGIRKAAQEKPDLILMDLRLPLVDGWEATKRIKAHSELRHIPVIAITSHAMVGDERTARAAGCDDYLTKPIDEDELKKKIDKLINL